MKKYFSIFLLLILLPGLAGVFDLGAKSVSAQTISPNTGVNQKVEDLFDSMTPAERVGQLFLISFKGTDVSEYTNIYNLIRYYHIGGVVLLSANDNFTGGTTTTVDAYNLIKNLQLIDWTQEDNQVSSQSNSDKNIYTPLFIGVSQEGDGYPNDQILNGLTALPNEMAIGATWSTELATSTGEILGSELSALGVNLIFGPSLDVMDSDYSEGNNSLGARSFGENPYWVGKLGKAYIEGVHNGSNNRLLVIATHFPGQGSSDRDPTKEIATIRKTYETLLNTDLAPFFAVTGETTNESETADGLLAGHMRYESLQGSIRSTTRPFSLDSSALDQVMALSDLSQWRGNGGILVSDNLGSSAIKQFYDPTNTNFDARQVARNAVIAGMDLLYVDNFVATGDIDQTTTIIRTLEFFVQKYTEDEAFAQRVDSAVKRILAKKFTMYPEFNPNLVIPDEVNLETLGKSSAITFEVAQRSVTLLHPQSSDFANTIPSAPGLSDRTVFFTEYKTYQQCSSCNQVEMITSDALQRSVIQLYGPDASGDTAQYLLSTFSYNDLLGMLNGEDGGQIVEEEIRAADWVVFAFMDIDSNYPASMALKRLLEERSDLLTNKYSIAFAFNAPYYLDATEIAKLSAYYAVYSKIPSFTEVAARVLFQEIVPSGKLPISLPAIGYDLNYVTSPTSTQNINLSLDTATLTEESTTEDEPDFIGTNQVLVPSFQSGDSIPLTTGEIFDHNNNPVPDGTTVTFYFTMDGETDFVQTLTSTTMDGIAKTEYLIPSEGRLEISASSGDAVNSNKLVLNILKGEPAIITVIVPTVRPTRTLTPTPVLPTETPSPTTEVIIETPVPITPTGVDWLFVMILVSGVSFGIYFYSKKHVSLRWAIRWSLLSAFGGLCAYFYIVLGIPEVIRILQSGRLSGILFAVISGLGSGWLIGWLWYRDFSKRTKRIQPPT